MPLMRIEGFVGTRLTGAVVGNHARHAAYKGVRQVRLRALNKFSALYGRDSAC